MVWTLGILVGVFVILAIGRISLAHGHRRLEERRALAVEYLSRFSQFVSEDVFDGNAYSWLTLKSVQMQDELGALGLVEYRPPAARNVISNRPVLLDFLPEIRKGKLAARLSRDCAEAAAACQEALLRYIGDLDRSIEGCESELKNPLVWLREGVQIILLLPLYLLYGLGVLSSATMHGIAGATGTKIVSAFITLFGLIVGIIGIVVDWKDFTDLLSTWWRNLF